MRRKKDPSSTYTQRLDVIKAKLRQLEFEKDLAQQRFQRKFGDKAAEVDALQQRIREKIESESRSNPLIVGYYTDGELQLSRPSDVSPDLAAMFEELRALRGEPPRVVWKPGWRCVCGNNTSVWFHNKDPMRPTKNGERHFRISCESCWTTIGTGSEEEMSAEVSRGLAKGVYSIVDRNKASFGHSMFRKGLSERLGVSMQDLPPHIGTIGHTIDEYVEKLQDLPLQIAERKAEEDESES